MGESRSESELDSELRELSPSRHGAGGRVPMHLPTTTRVRNGVGENARAWFRAFKRACISGSVASLTSTAALLAMGGKDCRSAFAPVNAISHWIWGDRAIAQQAPSTRYTVLGYLIHHAMSIMWAVYYEKWL